MPKSVAISLLSDGLGRNEEELGGLISLCPALPVAAQHLLAGQRTLDEEIKSCKYFCFFWKCLGSIERENLVNLSIITQRYLHRRPALSWLMTVPRSSGGCWFSRGMFSSSLTSRAMQSNSSLLTCRV